MDGNNTDQKPKRAKKRKQYAIRIGGELKRARFTTAELGRAWQRKMREDYEARKHGIRRALDPVSIDDVAEKFLEARSNLASRKHDAMRLRTYVLPYFSGRKIHEITRLEWIEIFGDGDSKAKGKLESQYKLSPRTSNMVRTLVHSLYEFARKRLECVQENPVSDIAPQHIPTKQFRCITSQSDIGKYLQAAQADQNKSYLAFAVIALNTGLRMGNIVTMRWEDIDFDAGVVIARYKFDYASNKIVEGLKGDDNSVLKLGLSASLRQFLLTWRSQTKYAAPTDLICAAQTTGEMLCRSTLQGCHERVVARSGLKYFNIHGLRHTYATMFLERGGSLYDLKDILNHSSITVTELYTHNLHSRLSQLSEVMSVSLPTEEQKNVVQIARAKK